MFGGGIADKFGNAYEARWAVRQLLAVFRAEVRSIRLEGISAAFKGFEFAVEHDDFVSWHQTKINAPGQNWTIRALEQEGVLAAFASRLRASIKDRCVFVSQSPAVDLLDLASKASYASDFLDFDGALPKTSREKFKTFCTTMEITPEVAFDWLSRCDFRTLPEEEITGLVETFGAVSFEGTPSAVYPALRQYLEERMNRNLTSEMIRGEIPNATPLLIRDWSLASTTRQRIVAETEAYLATYTPFGAAGHIVTRSQSDAVIELLLKETGPRVILLSGVAGSGKSGVVREILGKLTTHHVMHLALRVDQHLDCKTPADFGQALLGRSESPATTLKGLAPDYATVLLVDQIDAVSEISGRNGAAKDAILRMVDEARRYSTVRIILVCRSFDIESDERIKQLKQANGVVQIDVLLLDWTADVAPVVARLGVSPETLDNTQKELLCLPLNLAVFAEIASEGDTQFASRNDLFEKLLRRKERLIAANRDQVGWSVMAPLISLANWMSDRQRLDAPFSVLDDFPRADEVLASEHLIVRSRGTLNFFHESFFDYVFARAFSARAQSLVDLLTSTEQHLFRRTQVRQILESMRQSDRPRYLRELDQVLSDSNVRFHIKIAVAQWLAALAAPTDQERDIVLALDDPSKPFTTLVRTALQGTPGWFDVLQRIDWLAPQLRSPVELRKRAIFWWLGNAAGARPQPIAQLLDAWWSGDPDKGSELLEWFGYVRRQGPDQALVDLCQRVIQSRPPGMFGAKGNFRREFLIATWAAGESNVGAATILRAYFDAWFDEHPGAHPFARAEIDNIDLHSLGELSKKAPVALLDGSIDALARAFQLISEKTRAGGFESSFSHRARTGHNFGSDQYLQLIRDALKKVAVGDPKKARETLHLLDPQSHEAAAHLYLETISANAQMLAGELPPLLALPIIFEAGWVGAPWRSFADAAKAAIPYLDNAAREAIENVILSYQPELEFAVATAKELKAGKQKTYWMTPESVIGQLSSSGYRQFCILETIGQELLSPPVRRRLDELRRKFPNQQVQEPTHLEAYAVRSPIAKDSAERMNDEQWLSAIRDHNTDDERRRGNGSATGGAPQLAQVLQQLTKEDPDRFARLQLRIPGDANRAFIRQLLWGLAEVEAVSLASLQASMIDAHAREGKPYGDGIARLFELHPELGQSEACWNILIWYLVNGDALEDEAIETDHIERETVSIETLLDKGGQLYIRGLNGTRGRALEALSAVLWRVPERRANAWALIEDRIENEPSISARCCIPRPLLPMFNEDKNRCALMLEKLVAERSKEKSQGLAAKAIDKLNFPSPRIPLIARKFLAHAGQLVARTVSQRHALKSAWLSPLITHPATDLLPYIVHQVPSAGRRLLSKLLTYGNTTTRLVATWHIIRAGYNDADYVPLADTLEKESLEARRLAADIASHSIVHDAFRDRAVRNLSGYFNDEDKDVRREASGAFREIPGDQFFAFMELAQDYVASKAFETDNFAFLHALENAKCNVSGLVVAAAERVLRDFATDRSVASRRDMDLHQLKDLIKTEYSASENDLDLRKRLLDVIDQMLMLELSGTDEITKLHER